MSACGILGMTEVTASGNNQTLWLYPCSNCRSEGTAEEGISLGAEQAIADANSERESLELKGQEMEKSRADI